MLARTLVTSMVTSMVTDQLTTGQRHQAGFFLADGEGWGYGGSVRADGSYGWNGGAGTTARFTPRRGSANILFTQVALDGPDGSTVVTAFDDVIDA